MRPELHTLLLILVCAGVTIALRALPFLALGRGGGQPPALVRRLGERLPPAVMAILVIYCLRNTDVFAAPHGLPEIVSCLLVAVLHLWKRNTLISIAAGTAFYMFLVQAVF